MELRVYYNINIICPSISINRMVGILLVGGFNPSEKYESQLGLLSPIYGKIKMFQTTNQIIYPPVN